MKLVRCDIRNFQGIASIGLFPQGKNLNVFGDNGTGKTTIVSALSWLLTGKDALGRADFDIKPLNQYGESALEGDVDVSATFVLDSGDELALRKCYKEKMVKSRSAGEAAFAGHTTDYYLDGVPCQKKEYDEKVKEIADPELFRALTDPFYFPEALHWTKRREWLLAVCGDVKFEDVIAAESPELDELPAILGKRTVAEQRKVLAANKTEVAKELKELPARIDEQKRNVRTDLPDLRDDLQRETALIAKINSLHEDLARVKSGGQAAELRAQLRDAESEYTKAESDARVAEYARVRRLQAEHDKKCRAAVEAHEEANSKARKIAANIEALSGKITDLEQARDRKNAMADALTEEYYTEEAKEFSADDDCPTCGRPIEDKDRFNAVREFNVQKSQKLESIISDGKKLRAHAKTLQTDIDKLKEKLAADVEDLNVAQAECEKARKAIPATEDAIYTYSPTPEMLAAQQQVDDLKARIASLTVDTTEQDRITEALTEAQNELETLQAHINATNAAATLSTQAKERIKELQSRRHSMKEQSDLIERHLFLMGQFERAQALLLSERVNKHFKIVSWKLFDQQVNGDYNPCCEATVGGVPFNSGLNNGARINAGLDIINTLSKHAGVSLPVCVDNAESVTRLFPIDAQILRFVVSEQDKTLRMEIAE